MKNTRKLAIQEKVAILLKSSNVEDILIAQELMLKHARALGKDYIIEYLETTDWKENDFIVKIKRRLPEFKILELL